MKLYKNESSITDERLHAAIQEMVIHKLAMDKLDNSFNYHHLAGFWIHSNKCWDNRICIGENTAREARSGCCYSTHAEMEAIKRLPPLNMRGRKQHLNLVVIRVDRHGCLKNSAPCSKCIKHMEWINLNTSYKIKNIYYSNNNGELIFIKFSKLADSDEMHVSKRFRNK